MKLFFAAILVLGVTSLAGISLINTNTLEVNGALFDLNLNCSIRIAAYTHQPLEFSVLGSVSPDSILITYSSPEMDMLLSISLRSQYDAPAYLLKARAEFKQEIYVHELYFSMDNDEEPISARLKGVEAIQRCNDAYNQNILPFSNKAVEYTQNDSRFWIVASNYAECSGVEGLSSNYVSLYDYKGHFFRLYNETTGYMDDVRDCLYQPAGSSNEWTFLLFEEQPALLDINRWLGDNRAALCITNDADGETLDRLKAVYQGSNNPANPKYGTQGFFARNIPVTSAVYGVNQYALGDIWTTIFEHGNSIAYHTYTYFTDPAGTNAQALLTDLESYNIRTWIDHAVPHNPEDFAYNGLNPDSPNYVADVICESKIDYIWSGDTMPTNPFNAYDEAWRLPHIVSEAKSLTRPVWFFGRTRMEYWDYYTNSPMLCMKYLMTADNLDALLAARGLNICYTHLYGTNTSTYTSCYQIAENGDYEVRDDVDDMLLMLDYYRQNRGLWVATLEDIFDRMLDIEQVKVVAVEPSPVAGVQKVTLANSSERDIIDLSLRYLDFVHRIPLLTAGSTQSFYISKNAESGGIPPCIYTVHFESGQLLLTDALKKSLQPLKVEIFNLRGQRIVVQELTTATDLMTIPFAGKASGIYFARISSLHTSSEILRFSVVK